MFTQTSLFINSDFESKDNGSRSVEAELTNFVCLNCGCHLNDKQFCGPSSTYNDETRRECSKCADKNIEIKSQSELKQQENSYKIHRPFNCTLCSSMFDRASQLEYHHRNMHLKEKSQICQFCGKGFFRKADLRTHLNIHLGTNFCICEICGKKFNHISNLIRHCRMHTGVKPYPCLLCGKRFTQISSLVRHKNVHERENQCSYSITHNKKLKDCTSKDTKKTMKRQHYCQTCGESFCFIFLLREHQKSHAEDTELGKSIKSSDKGLENLDIIRQQKFKEKCSASANEEHKRQELVYIIANRKGAEEAQLVQSVIYIYPDQEETILRSNATLQKLLTEYYNEGMESTRVIDVETNENMDYNTSGDVHKHNDIHTEISNKETVIFSPYNDLKKINNMANVHIINESNPDCLTHDNKVPALTQAANFGTTLSDNFSLSRECSNAPLNKEQPVEKTTEMPCGLDKTEVFLEASEPILKVKDVKDTLINNKQAESTENSLLNLLAPGLRLIHSETGEPFYELVMNSSLEKVLSNSKKSNMDETKLKVAITPKEDEKVTDRIEYTFDNFMNVEHDLNCTLFDLHDERKRSTIFGQGNEQSFYTNIKTKEHQVDTSGKDIQNIQNLSLAQMGHDAEIDFESYVEKGFDILEKVSYDQNADQFLEFIEITEENKKMITSFSCRQSLESEQNGNEQMIHLLEDCGNIQELGNACTNNSSDNSITTVNLVMCSAENIKSHNGNKSDKDVEGVVEQEQTDINLDNSDNTNKTNMYNMKKIKEPSKKFQCNVCKKLFSTAYSYKQHLGTHFTDQQKFHCKECKLSFAWKSTLNKHLANNHRTDGPQKYVCQICPKVYRTLSQVNEHVKRDHLKQRNHTCLLCGKSFFKKFDLKTHSRTHTDERPYVCRSCGKTFHHQSHIIRHERTHSGERPYSCDICHKSFTQLSSLKMHKQKHQQTNVDIMDCQLDEDDPLALARL